MLTKCLLPRQDRYVGLPRTRRPSRSWGMPSWSSDLSTSPRDSFLATVPSCLAPIGPLMKRCTCPSDWDCSRFPSRSARDRLLVYFLACLQRNRNADCIWFSAHRSSRSPVSYGMGEQESSGNRGLLLRTTAHPASPTAPSPSPGARSDFSISDSHSLSFAQSSIIPERVRNTPSTNNLSPLLLGTTSDSSQHHL